MTWLVEPMSLIERDGHHDKVSRPSGQAEVCRKVQSLTLTSESDGHRSAGEPIGHPSEITLSRVIDAASLSLIVYWRQIVRISSESFVLEVLHQPVKLPIFGAVDEVKERAAKNDRGVDSHHMVKCIVGTSNGEIHAHEHDGVRLSVS